MKKRFALLLAVLLLVSLAAGCTGSNPSAETTATPAPASAAPTASTGSETTGSDANEPTAAPEADPGELTLPLVEDKQEFEIYYSNAVIGSTMSDLNDGYAIQELEKRTNIHIKWIYPSSAAQNEQFKGIHEHMGTVGTDRWIELADDFMMVNFGIIDRHYAMGHRPGMAL